MLRDTALTICPKYPPQNLERLPYYEGDVSTQEENIAVFRNLWNQGQSLLHGSMSLYSRDMRLTTNTSNNTVIGTLVQQKRLPECGFALKMTEATPSAPQSLYVEMKKICGDVDNQYYVRRRMFLYDDGSARRETLRQGMIGQRTLSEADYHYDRQQHLTMEDLRNLDDLYAHINPQQEKQARNNTERATRRPSLAGYIGRRAMLAWYYLTG